MAKKKAVKHTKKPLHHRVAHHLDKPVNTLFGYTIILVFLVMTLIVLAKYL